MEPFALLDKPILFCYNIHMKYVKGCAQIAIMVLAGILALMGLAAIATGLGEVVVVSLGGVTQQRMLGALFGIEILLVLACFLLLAIAMNVGDM